MHALNRGAACTHRKDVCMHAQDRCVYAYAVYVYFMCFSLLVTDFHLQILAGHRLVEYFVGPLIRLMYDDSTYTESKVFGLIHVGVKPLSFILCWTASLEALTEW